LGNFEKGEGYFFTMEQKVILNNGVQILTEDIPHVRSVALGIWVHAGSRDEPPEMAGVSHFIEHLLFKGTLHRTARQIAEALEAVGGQLNAFTTKEFTCYYARVMDEYFDLALDVLADMIFNPLFKPEDLDRERNVIREEIKMYEDTPDELIHDVFATTIWKGHALGRPIIGNAQVISSLTREQILAHYQKNYAPANLVVAVAGNINHQQVVEKLQRVFGSGRGQALTRQQSKPVPHAAVTCRTKETEQVHLCLGVPGLPLEHEQIYVFQIISTILGGGLSSRLFQEIRENQGLVYSIYSYHSSYHDTGLFCIYAGLSKNNVVPVIELVFKEIRDLQRKGITGEELRRAKDQMKGNLFLSLENVSTRMSRLAKSQLYLGKIVRPEEVVEKINQVTAAQVKEVAGRLLEPEIFALASIGPWDDCATLCNMRQEKIL
jgi:predicted Zn-dependent peptidase